jgi:hypothetical protein
MTKLMDEFERYHAGEVTWPELQDYIANFKWAPDPTGTRNPDDPDEAFLEPVREDSCEELLLAAACRLITAQEWAALSQIQRTGSARSSARQ